MCWNIIILGWTVMHKIQYEIAYPIIITDFAHNHLYYQD